MEGSVGSLTAGTKNRGDIEERITGILKEIKDSPETLDLFVGEIHFLMSGSGKGVVANLLKPMLAGGERSAASGRRRKTNTGGTSLKTPPLHDGFSR